MPQVTVYYSPYCPVCRAPRRGAPAGIVWRDVTRHLEEAAALGVRRPPAVVIDGRLRCQGAAAVSRLRQGEWS